jgi:hypothetical protein
MPQVNASAKENVGEFDFCTDAPVYCGGPVAMGSFGPPLAPQASFRLEGLRRPLVQDFRPVLGPFFRPHFNRDLGPVRGDPDDMPSWALASYRSRFILRIWTRRRPFSSPELCHNQTEPTTWSRRCGAWARSSGAGSRPLLIYGLAGAMKTTHTVEVDFKPSGSARRPFRRARRNVRCGPFNPTLLAGIEDEPNRAAHRCSKRL